MKETLIKDYTKKLANDKGFDINQYIIYSYKNGTEESESKGISQSLIQKWLRDNHNIHINVSQVFNASRQIYSVKVNKVADFGLYNSNFIKCGKYNDYEEALEIGINSALSLI